ncbi:Serine/arginine repetitive matrix protein 2 [Rhodotorula diobovata]|uniref:Serine/arginine repetitive matrix protein 2 n=1 Tax=Rhodotorula diobovata TaxID=5288 RepID=A0A5C5FSI9_9BASI|nr:Serine/arginine repetitive matrix protein 2 [Rhodotorula diobovata]
MLSHSRLVTRSLRSTGTPRLGRPPAVVRLVVAAPHLAVVPTRRHYAARPPSFTTPAEPDLPPLPAHGHDHHHDKPLEPLPPTNLPIEDYASPLVHTASFFGQLFRYAVSGSVAIVATTALAVVAVHLYVEHVELAPPDLDPSRGDDPHDWALEQPGWSGLHTDKRGGTDSRLGVLARAAVRGAFIAQTWGSGSLASPLAEQAPAATAPSSAFAVARMGGDMIGAKHNAAAAASQGRQVGDGGWLLAERYLLYALSRAAARGIALDDGGSTWEQRVDHGGVDRAAVELEERLAGVRERIGGRARLEAARDGWERIYFALQASPTTDPARGDEQAWEQRETLVATRKLGELSARIADLWQEGTDERRVENDRAEGYFLGGLVPVLARGESQSLKGAALDALVPGATASQAGTATKHASPSSSFFGFWARSHPPATPATQPGATPSPDTAHLSPELAHLVALVQRASSSASSLEPSLLSRPATQRALLASLVSLETFLARRRDPSSSSATTPSLRSLAAAQSIQSAALSYARALSTPPPSPESATGVPSLEPAHVSRALTAAYTATRIAALETHLAECTLARSALSYSSSGLFSRGAGGAARAPAKTDLDAARALLGAALSRAERAADDSAALLALLETEGKGRKGRTVEKAFGESLRRARRDAEKVRELGRGLERFVQAQA